ncbi:hypothetical protein ABT026_22560 [Streptomyces sp. NPDC002734]|uniref:hypothetical protein n=1 Tax=Streptomyces sp. NPDC002734 TaxID=3154426 RepID=UPI00331A058E
MNHSSGAGAGPGHERQRAVEPRRAESGRWPVLEAALAVVNRDLSATLPGQDELVLVVAPSGGPPGPDGRDQKDVYVALLDGRWHGDRVNAGDPEAGDPPEPEDPSTALAVVAEAAQETVMELLRKVWPTCPEHRTGLHSRPAGTTDAEETRAAGVTGPPVRRCGGGRDGESHDVAVVGELAARRPDQRDE